MTGPATVQRSNAAALAAVLLGVLVGLVQAADWAGFLHSRRAGSGPDHIDRGLGAGSGVNLGTELLWLLGMLVVSVVLVTIALALLRIRWYGLLMPVVLVVEFLLAGWLGPMLARHSDWRGLALAPVLALELLGCRLLLPQRPVE